MISKLLLLILSLARLAVDDTQPGGDDDNVQDTLSAAGADTVAGGGDDADLDLGEDTISAPAEDEKEKLAKEREEYRGRAERAEREAAELRVRHTPKQTSAVEEEENRKLADPTTPELDRWRIESNRTMRANTNATQIALAQAMDLRDQTSFKIVTATDPRAKRYETRVEEELAKARSGGGNPSREAIYTYLLGKDMREGKFQKKTPAAPRPQHGKTPGARSDVSARGGAQSNRDKLAKKLDGVQI